MKIVQVLGHRDPPTLVTHGLFRQDTIPGKAEHMGHLIDRQLTLHPPWEKRIDHAVTQLESGHVPSDGDDLTRRVGTWDQRLSGVRAVFAVRHDQVTPIQRYRVNANLDIPVTQRWDSQIQIGRASCRERL